MPPPEPNKRIEDALNAYSKKRREQLEPGVDLHPVSRKALLQEVSQTFSQTNPAAVERRSAFSWWRWAAVTIVAAWVVFLGIYVQIQPTKPLDTSLTESFSNVPPVRHVDGAEIAALAKTETTPPANVAAPTSAVSMANSVPTRSLRIAAGAVQENRKIANNNVAVADEVAPAQASAPAQVTQQQPAPVAQPRSVPVAAATTAPSAPAQPSESRQYVRVTNRSQFRENVQAPPLPRVLTAFALERTGDKVRVTDADGSVYEGSISQTQQGGAYSFQVSGTSQRLERQVVFNGTVGAKPNECDGEVQIGKDIEFQLQAVSSQ